MLKQNKFTSICLRSLICLFLTLFIFSDIGNKIAVVSVAVGAYLICSYNSARMLNGLGRKIPIFLVHGSMDRLFGFSFAAVEKMYIKHEQSYHRRSTW